MANEMPFFTGITRRRWTGLVLTWVAILILFTVLYLNAQRSVMNEIRHQAMGVAIAISAALDPGDLAQVGTPEDTARDAYRRVQEYLGRVQGGNPDVRYVYTMRRAEQDDSRECDYEFVVDAAARDVNGNGEIDRDEVCEPPGKPYCAAKLPELIRAWYEPGADREVTPDPPYPDLLSGYAPVKNARGQTAAVVGVDITAATVSTKLFALRAVMAVVWLVLGLLITLVVRLYYQQRDALERNKNLSEELASRNDMLRAANLQLAQHNEQFRRDLKLAQSVQLGFLPTQFPRQDKVIFDKYYLTCEMLGGDLFDVFSLDEDHVGIYMADVAGHGVSSALISGLLKMAVASVRERHFAIPGQLPASLAQPDALLSTLNDMLIKEMPESEFITMIYAVLDIPRYTFTVASAGHLAPVQYEAKTGGVNAWAVPTGTALGLVTGTKYPVVEQKVAPGDKVIFYTDGLTEALNELREEFGEPRFLDLVKASGSGTPAEIIQAIKQGLEKHRGPHAVSDDFSILVAEIQ